MENIAATSPSARPTRLSLLCLDSVQPKIGNKINGLPIIAKTDV
ncbi:MULTISPECIES: hypothetical protein [unclassified Caballeronia]|nr:MULTISPECIES: hypothetical protein [unclassified Caballeronia]